MIKRNYSLVLTVLEPTPVGPEEIYRVESLPDRTKMMIRSPGNSLIVINDPKELLDAIAEMQKFGLENPTEVQAATPAASIDAPMIVEYGPIKD